MPNQPHVRVARAYEPPRPGDGIRVLVDRIWQRGLSKFAACLDVWCKQLAPSTGDIPGDDRTAVIAGVAAFLDGMESAHNAGHEPSTVASVASFFVSRLDTKVDRPLDKLSTVQAAQQRGRAAIANACLAYQRYEEMLTSSRWTYLAAAKARRSARSGPRPPRRTQVSSIRSMSSTLSPPAWSTPCPRARFTRRRPWRGATRFRTRPLRRRAAGTRSAASSRIDYDEAVQSLEDEAKAKFDAGWEELGSRLADQLGLGPSRQGGREAPTASQHDHQR
jgi:hypothetical protein